MNHDPSQRRSRGAYCLLLLGSLLLTTALRWQTFDEPLEADEAIYAVMARDWLAGGKPYQTLWDVKPIGTFLVYRWAIGCFDDTEAAPKKMACLAFVLTTFVLWLLLRGSHRSTQLLVLLGIWPQVSILPSAFANGANSEVFMLPLLLGGLAAMRQYREQQRQRWWWLAVALVTGSLLIKRVALPYLPALLLLLPLSCWRCWRTIAWRGAAIIGIALTWQLGVYWLAGYSPLQFLHSWQQALSYTGDSRYGSGLTGWLWTLLSLPFQRPVWVLWPVTVGAVIGIWLDARNGRAQRALEAGAWGGATLLAILLPGKNFAHYYILALPIIVLYGVNVIEQPGRGPLYRLWLLSVATIGLTAHTWHQTIVPSSEQLSFHKYHSNWFNRDRVIGRELLRLGFGGTRMYADGGHPGVYFYAHARPASKYFFSWAWEVFGVTSWPEFFAELRRAPPDVCVIQEATTDETQAWLAAEYELVTRVRAADIYRLRTRRAAADPGQL